MKKYLFLLLLGSACSQPAQETADEIPTDWVKNATIYEVNVRQYSSKGDFASFEKGIPKLKELGIDLLWFMPIQPIGKLNRKAVGDTFVQDMPNPDYEKYWGSHYSIADYTNVNPRYGSVEEFKSLVEKCHENGMKVVLDWVANHSAWDNAWVDEHPDWYTKDSTGKITDPIGEDGKSWGWTDVADLDYDSKEMRLAMIEAMKFWVIECDIDGFRCDVAMEVPTDFWEEARTELEKVKPMFMLAESEAHKPDHFNMAFDAYYGWEMHHVMNEIYKGEANADDIARVMNEKDSICGEQVFPMNFITNHDENSWNGTVKERLDESWKAMAVLSYALRGMPLIYTGQEVGLNHRLSFFGKDSVNWNNANGQEHFNFYKELNEIKEDQAFSVESPIVINEEYSNMDLLVIDRGENATYRIAINMTGNDVSISKDEFVLDDGYTEVSEYKRNEDLLGPWGFVILKR